MALDTVLSPTQSHHQGSSTHSHTDDSTTKPSKPKRNRNKSAIKRAHKLAQAQADASNLHTPTITNDVAHNITAAVTLTHQPSDGASTAKPSRSQRRKAKLASDNNNNSSDIVSPQQKSNSKPSSRQPNNGKDKASSSSHTARRRGVTQYTPYMSAEQIQQQLDTGELVRGVIRCVTLNTAFVTLDGAQKFASDILIDGKSARNRSYDGDIVAVRLLAPSHVSDLRQNIQRRKQRQQQDRGGQRQNKHESLTDSLKRLVIESRDAADKAIANERNGTADRTQNSDNSSVLTKSTSSTASKSDTESSHNDTDHQAGAQAILARKQAIEQAVVETQRAGVVVGIIEKKHSRQCSCYIELPDCVQNLLDGHVTRRAVKQLHSHMSMTAMPLDAKSPKALLRFNDLPSSVTEIVAKLKQLFVHDKAAVAGQVDNDDQPHDDIKQAQPTIKYHKKQLDAICEQAELVSKQIYIGEYHDWQASDSVPYMRVNRVLGCAGELEAETSGILAMNDITYNLTDFPDEVLKDVDKFKSWSVTAADLADRRDYRNTRIFTIDPLTARDLDDALHITKISEEIFQVGVHIADVSYFIRAGSDLDKEAADRATSVYLVQRVIPMLPRLLCEQLCSLNPGKDRLAYSCVFQMNTNGEVVNRDKTWFGRTVINSCAKLDYGTAQRMIDYADSDIKKSDQLPGADRVQSAIHTVHDVIADVAQMNRIAVKRRAFRFSSSGGSLALHNVKLAYKLDQHAMPQDFNVYPLYDSNRMIEEYMLLANMLVAEKITSVALSTEFALLRCHPAPPERSMIRVLANLAEYGFVVDASSAGSMHQSLSRLEDVKIGNIQLNAKSLIESLATRPMEQAKYFCTADLPQQQWRHYALNFTHYTHFTSPIRRYADVTVHRVLDCVLKIEQLNDENKQRQLRDQQYPLLSEESTSAIAAQCNRRKVASKRAQDASTRLYLTIYIHQRAEREQPPLRTHAVVVGVQENTFDVVMPDYGIEKRMYVDDMVKSEHVQSVDISGDSNKPKVRISWRTGVISNLRMFDGVTVQLGAKMTPPIDVTVHAVAPITSSM